MRILPSGVVMVTVDVDGRPWGLTISSCASLSVEPPQVVLSLASHTVTCRRILATRSFGLSLLGADHRHVAEHGAAPGTAKFIDEFCVPGRGEFMPSVRDAAYHLGCSLVAAHVHADHTLVVGGVVEASKAPASQEPMVYFDRAFRRVGERLA
jgi:flavin reductase (DIM6/NTAB) family NADH-FMN oxidoreductase RutF